MRRASVDEHSIRVRAALGVAIVGVAGSSIVVRWLRDQSVPPLVVAAFRMLFAMLLLLGPALAQRAALGRLRRDHLGRLLLAGGSLALHFGSFTASLYFIGVARAVLLVHLQPIAVIALSAWLLNERPSRFRLACVAVSIGGVLIMSYGPSGSGPEGLQGDLLALVAALSLAVYLLAGRSLREVLPTSLYAAVVYGVAAILLFGAALAQGDPVSGFAPATWLLFVVLAVLPTLCGHTLFNWALRHVPASTVSLAFLGEPPAAALLALVFLGEVPPLAVAAGGLLCLAGIAGAITSAR